MVEIFTRQVLQLVTLQQLCWPSPEELRKAQTQQLIYDRCFATSENSYLPPERYRYAILKLLLRKIENAIVDPEEDEISDDLMTAFSELVEGELPSELEAAQKRSWVTYQYGAERDQGIHLLENRSVSAGSGTTGLRTWEAALHLGQYLLSSSVSEDWIKDKTILELGAGTGLLSMLCANPLGAREVLCTDGSEECTEGVKENLGFNSQVTGVSSSALRWGWTFKDTVLEHQSKIDTVIGADVTYDKSVIPALVATIRQVFAIWPQADVVISATIRNTDTFDAFEQACNDNGFSTQDIDFPVRRMQEQTTLFYASTVPIRILHIKVGNSMPDQWKIV